MCEGANEIRQELLRAAMDYLLHPDLVKSILDAAPVEPCGAQEWAHDDGSLIIYGTCQLPADHESRYHCEMRDGQLWASWSGPRERAPSET